MADIRVYINNTEADTYEDIGASLATTLTVSDIREINDRLSSYTKTIKLPATETNKVIFGFAEDVNSLSAFDNTTKIDGRIEVDGTVIIDGVVKLNKPVIDFSKGIKEYEINILSGIADWKSLIGDLNVRDLDFSAYNHTYTLVNQNLSETTNGTAGTLADRFIVYPLINYGAWQGGYISGVVAGTGVQEVITVDRKPALNVYDIIQKIFNNQGFTIVSTFLDSAFAKGLYIPFFHEKLLAPAATATANEFRAQLSGTQYYATGYALTSSFYEDGLTGTPTGGLEWFGDKIAFNDDSTAGFYDNPSDFVIAASVPSIAGGQNPSLFSPTSFSGGVYTATVKSKQIFTAKIAGTIVLDYVINNGTQNFNGSSYFVPAVSRIEVKVIIKLNNAEVVSEINSLITDPLALVDTTTTVDFNTTLETPELDIEVGDTVYCSFTYSIFHTNSGSVTVGGATVQPIRVSNLNSSLTIDTGSLFYNQVSLELAVGETVDININLPDIEQMDLVKALKQLFNLYYYTDLNEKKIYIEPRTDFYNNSAVDWSGKLDISQPIEIELLGDSYNRKMLFRYKLDSSDQSAKDAEGEEAPDFILASHKEDLTNIFSKEGVGKNRNDLFAPTVMDVDPDQLGWKINKLPKMWKKFEAEDDSAPEFNTKTLPRILYYEGAKNILSVDSLYYNTPLKDDTVLKGQDIDPDTNLPYSTTWIKTTYASMYSVDVNTVNDNSLYFNTTDKSHGLYEKYYRDTIKTINEGKLIHCYMNLTAVDIETIDFRVPVIIEIDNDFAFCVIQTIHDYNPSMEGTTKVTLLTIADTTPLTAIVNTTDNENTRTINKRIRRLPLQTDLNGVVAYIYTEIQGTTVPVYKD